MLGSQDKISHVAKIGEIIFFVLVIEANSFRCNKCSSNNKTHNLCLFLSTGKTRKGQL